MLYPLTKALDSEENYIPVSCGHCIWAKVGQVMYTC